ncbi:MAG: hypothetical protein EBZ77_14480, partial [Chitinophagia bacterium]|nr:hypothetical protein [Chitinophagia bacterium]
MKNKSNLQNGVRMILPHYRKGNFLILLVLAAIIAVSAKSLHAATYYWDANGNTSGTGGTGTWSSSAISSSSGGTSGAGQNTTSADTVIFGTVTNVGTMNFTANNYVLTTSSSGANVVLTNASTILGANVNLTLNPNSAVDLGFKSGVISGGAGSTLSLSNATSASRMIRLYNYDISNNLAINVIGAGTGIIGFYESGGSSTIKANVTNNSANSFNIGASSGNVLTVEGVISGSGKVNVGYGATTGGAGRVSLNSANSYTGDTVVVLSSTGTLRVGVNNAISTNSIIQHGTTGTSLGGIIDLYGNNQTVAGLASGASAVGRITNSLTGVSTLTVNQATDTSYGLAIGGNIALVKTNTGNLALTVSNAYSGGTTVSGGTLTAANTSALGTGSVTVGSGATLSVRANVSNTVANSGT